MSWSFSVPAGPAGAEDFRARCETARDTALASYSASEEEKAAMLESINASIEVAVQTLLPIAQPDLGGQVSASFNGDANPGHKPRAGYANDCIGVNIYQQSP
jgi:hypothetical protein